MPKSARSPTPSPKSQHRRRPRNLRPAEARRLLVAFERSGLAVAEFERRHNLSPNRLSWWRKRLGLGAIPSPSGVRLAPDSATVTFLPVRVAAAPPSRSASPPLPPTPSAAPIELVLPDGAVVRVPPSFDPTSLARLLDVLREARAC